jgi:predicted nucleic-acid-binding protein
MRAVDAGVLVGILAGDDSQKREAAESFVEGGAWVSIVVLADTLFILRKTYGQDASSIARAVSMLLNHDQLVLQDSDAVSGALEIFRERPSLGFADCLMLALARKAGHLPLGTFDRKLAKLPGAQRL